MNCLRCDKLLEPKFNQITKRLNLDPRRKFCDKICQTRYTSLLHHIKNRDNKEFRKKKNDYFKKYYQTHKERQFELVKADYHKNKNKWRQRRFISLYRELILDILPKTCFLCGRLGIKEIHHESYNQTMKKSLLKEYCKNLRGFCSRDCHRKYELNSNQTIKNRYNDTDKEYKLYKISN